MSLGDATLMPGGFGKDVGDPWHSLSDEVRFAHAYGWQVAMPSNAADAVGLLRRAMRGANPTVFFEHRSLLMTSDGSARYPGDDFVVPFGTATVVRQGTGVTVVSWSALVHRCAEAAAQFGDEVELIDLRTIAPWDRDCVLASVRKTGRCVIVHVPPRPRGPTRRHRAPCYAPRDARDCTGRRPSPRARIRPSRSRRISNSPTLHRI